MYKYIFFLSILLIFILSFTNHYNNNIESFQTSKNDHSECGNTFKKYHCNAQIKIDSGVYKDKPLSDFMKDYCPKLCGNDHFECGNTFKKEHCNAQIKIDSGVYKDKPLSDFMKDYCPKLCGNIVDNPYLDNMSSDQIKLFKLPDAYLNGIRNTLAKSNNEEDKKILAEFEANLNKDRSIQYYKYNENGQPVAAKKNYNYFNEIDKRMNIPDKIEINMDSLTGSLKSLQEQVDILIFGKNKKYILGNEYLIKSGKCKIRPNNCIPDENNNCIVDKYSYINNIPVGHPNSLYANRRGLIPGLLESITTFPINKFKKTSEKIDVPYCDNTISN